MEQDVCGCDPYTNIIYHDCAGVRLHFDLNKEHIQQQKYLFELSPGKHIKNYFLRELLG